MSKENIGKSIKEKLQIICDKIEKVLIEYNNNKSKENDYSRQTQDIYNINNGSKINVIKSLKQNVSLMQNNLETIYDIGKINKIESEIKKKNLTIKNLSKEQKILCDLIQKQQESIEDYSSKFTTNKEISEFRNQLKFAKEENHMSREAFKLLNSKIKGQLSKIDILEKKSKIIRQNIEFQQKKQKKEVENSMNAGDNEDEIGEESENRDDLNYLMVTEKMLMLEIDEEEKSFKNEINHQNDVIIKLIDRINEIKERKNAIKLKIKEDERMKKIKLNKSKEKHKNKNQNNENKISRNNIIYKSNDYQKYIYNSNNKFICKIGESPKNKNENINFYSNTKSTTKPFDIKKFNLVYNNNLSARLIMDINNPKIYSSMYNYNSETKGNKNDDNQINQQISPLKEIEQLQNEIKYALKNNVAIINIQNIEKHNDESNKDGHKNNNDNIIKINQNSDINNKKNTKPFEKFNFN